MARKWTAAARKRLSQALKKHHALKKLAKYIPAHPVTATPRKVTVPQGARDFDAIMGRFQRMERAGQQFVIGQLLHAFKSQHGESS